MSDDYSTEPIVPSGWRAAVGVAPRCCSSSASVCCSRARLASPRCVTRSREADSTWFVVCLGAQVVALTAYADVFRGAFRWHGGPDPGVRLSVHVMLASVGATRVFAAGGVGAIAVTYWCFRRARFSARGCTRSRARIQHALLRVVRDRSVVGRARDRDAVPGVTSPSLSPCRGSCSCPSASRLRAT